MLYFAVNLGAVMMFEAAVLHVRENETQLFRFCVIVSGGNLGNISASVQINTQDGSAIGTSYTNC